MNKLVTATLAAVLSTAAYCSDAPPAGEGIRIGLSPAAEKNAKLAANMDIYRSANSEKWMELNPSERNETLAGISWSKEDARLRERAIRDLARQSPSEDKDGEGVKALASVAVAEGDGSLRALARKALAARGDKRTADLLVRSMAFDDPLIKANTVEAIREIGGPRVFEIIVEHWKQIWGASPRDHIFVGQQRSYIADYDISGNSYDPIVRSFMTGVVLDAKVLKVEGDVYYVWIREITGDRKLPNEPGAWLHWLKKNELALAKKAEQNKAAAAEFFKN